MGIGTQRTASLGDSAGRAELIIKEITESRVAGASLGEGGSSFSVDSESVFFNLMTDIETGANGVPSVIQAERVLKLVEIFSPALGEVLDRAKRGVLSDVQRRSA